MLWHSMPRSSGHGRGRLNWSVLADYALRFRSQALVQHLGYLADLLSLPMDGEPGERLLRGSERNTCYLARLAAGGAEARTTRPGG
jgi:hypothetical protein